MPAMDFRSWVLESFTPVVMVVASPAVEAAVQQRNGLTIADLLRPSGYFHHLSVPIQTVGEAPYRIREFRLRFFASETMWQPPQEAADEYLKGVLTEAAKDVHNQEVSDIMAMLRSGEVAENTPWFDTYKAEFLRALLFNDHETFDHPLACLVVLDSSEADPVAAAAELLRGAALPPLLKAGIMDSQQLLKHYLLLHDAAAGGAYKQAEEKLQAMRATFGASAVGLARVNGAADAAAEHAGGPVGYAALWRAHVQAPLPGGGAGEPAERPRVPDEGLGAALSDRDVDSVKAALEEFLVRSLLPALQQRVRQLHFQVMATRKGLRNQFRSFLGIRKSGGAGGLSPEPARSGAAAGRYDAATAEFQLRQLADAAFMLQDYETAASALQFAATDFKAERAWKHYAGTQEMLGVTAFLTGGRLADVAGHFRDAFARYTSPAGAHKAPDGVRLATRAMLLLAAYCREVGAHAEANYALMRAHFQEENLRAALLLEQAAWALLRTQPPHARKFAFHMVLSGLRYNACGQVPLGVRAYRQVLGVYRGQRWSFIEEHLHEVLGRTAREGGDLQEALEHYGAVLACGGAPGTWQASRLRTFLDTVQQASLEKGVPVVAELPLPEVDVANVRVHFDDARCAGNAAARSQPERAWKQLEAAFAPPGADGSTWLEAGAARGGGGAATLGTCVAGELVAVDVEVSNPLQIELNLSELRVMCELQPAAGSAAAAARAAATAGTAAVAAAASGIAASGSAAAAAARADAAAADVAADAAGTASLGGAAPGEAREGGGGAAAAPGVEALEQTLRLRGGERSWVRLEARPLAAGTLTLTGVQWALNGTALGRRQFAPRPPRKKADRVAEAAARLALAVMPAMPRLEAELAGLPPTLLAGELACCTLRLRNAGGGALHRLRCATGQPVLHLGGSAAELGADPLQLMSGTAASSGGGSGSSDLRAEPVAHEQFRSGQQLYSFSGGGRLEPGGTLDWPLWLHPTAAGELAFQYVLYYEPVTPVEGMKYRCLRLAHSVTVLPSLSAAPVLRPSATDLHSYLLRLQLANLQTSATVSLERAVTTSRHWGASRLPPPAATAQTRQQPGAVAPAIDMQERVPPGAASSAFLYLHPPAAEAAAQGLGFPSPSPLGAPPRSASSTPSRSALSTPAAGVHHLAGPVAWFHGRGAPRASDAGAAADRAGEAMGAKPARLASGGAALARDDAAAAASGSSTSEATSRGGGGGAPSGSPAASGGDATGLVLAWSAASPLDDVPRRGFTHLYGVRLKERLPCRAVVRGPRRLRHDFATGGPCVVRLELCVRNCLRQAASISVEAGPQHDTSSDGASATSAWSVGATALAAAGGPAEAGSSMQRDVASAPDVVWCGTTRATVPSLQGGSEAEVPLQLAVFRAGQYQVTDYLLSWTYPDLSSLHDARPGPPLVLTVEDASAAAPRPAAAAAAGTQSLMDLL